MLKSLPSPLRALSTAQWILLATVFIVASFLLVGTLFQPAGDPSPIVGAQPFAVLAFLAFAGGLLSFVSPCTLPVLTAYFAFAFQSGRTQIAANTMAFMLGLATTFSIFGAGAFALGSVLYQNQQLILLIGGSLIVIFGVMSLLGKGFGGMQTAGIEQHSTTPTGSYLFGLTFAIGWSSCVGPILGTVLTLAAQTSSVTQGMMLLFIYALGLGLPLMMVSTLFGRANRQSLFWRVLRGKGWQWQTHMIVVALVWALAIWRILVAVADYAFRNLAALSGQTFTTAHTVGLLLLTLAGAALWVFTSSEERRTTVQLHTTQLVSGALFILIGLLMLDGRLATFNDMIPPQLAEWLAVQEERLIELFR